jgi:DNA uptake protein ComE-like DNA-binding protein
MSLPSEHKALIFVGAVAVLGAGVRVVRASNGGAAPASQPALEHQLKSADSSALAAFARMNGRSRGSGGGRGRFAGGVSSGAGAAAGAAGAPADTTKHRRPRRPRTDSASRAATNAPMNPPQPIAPLDRRGHIGGRLDMDVATAAQIDSLPGVLPAMAKRIVADRLARGPFLTMNGLRRVSGVGPMFVANIDSLVMFSGTVVQPNFADTVIPRRKYPRAQTRPHGA